MFKLGTFLVLLVSICFTSNTSQAITINDDAPSFTLKSMHNEELLSLSQFKGKVVYLDFWASWCGPCRKSFPFLSKLYQRYQPQGFEIISVNLDEHPELAQSFLNEFPTSFGHLVGFETNIAHDYDIQAMPSAFFIDTKGKVRLIHKGFKSSHEDFIEAVLEKLLAEMVFQPTK